MMLLNEFFGKYANTPLADRFVKLNVNGLNLTLHQIYLRLQELDNQMRPVKIQIDELLEEAENYYKLKKE